jgi:DNA-binding transcriptional LysR family regulator
MHTLEQISAFVAVYEQGSYSNAAKLLGKSRTTVREHVVAYEDLLGYSLFVINGRKAVPTDRANQLYHRAKLVEKQNRSLFVQSQTLYETDVHTINICYDVITPLSLIAYVEDKILHYNSDIKVNWQHRTRQRAMELLLSDSCDIAIMPYRGQTSAEKEVTWQGIGSVPVGCFARPDSPLALADDLKIEELMLDTQYLTENFASLHASFAAVRVSPKMHLVSNNDLLCELVKRNGWTVMPKHYMAPWVERGELVELKLKEVSSDITFGLNAFFCFGKSDIEVFGLILDWMTEWHLQQR